MAKPFLKWAGGKTQLLPEIALRLPDEFAQNITTYVEPFLGGGAVFFYLQSKFKFENVYLSDINPELILCYTTIKNNVDSVIAELREIQNKYLGKKEEEREKMFYETRNNWNKEIGKKKRTSKQRAVRTAQTIFLNRTCFNGLFRVNSKAEFNVPFGSYKNPRILDVDNLKSVSKALVGVTIEHRNYLDCEKEVKDSTVFVYFDPPYRPLDTTSNFTSYAKSGFNDADQLQLADLFSDLSNKGANLMLSNSDPHDDFFENAYKKFPISYVKASRNINSVGSKRGKVSEIIVTNYKHGFETSREDPEKQSTLSQFEHDDLQ